MPARCSIAGRPAVETLNELVTGQDGVDAGRLHEVGQRWRPCRVDGARRGDVTAATDDDRAAISHMIVLLRRSQVPAMKVMSR